MKLNILAIAALFVIASCTQPQSTSSSMSEVSFNYSGPNNSGNFLVDTDYMISSNGAQTGNAYAVLQGTAPTLTLTSFVNLNTFINFQNSNINSQFNTPSIFTSSQTGGVSTLGGGTARVMFIINGLGYMVIRNGDSLNIAYTYSNNKLNGTFNGRLSRLINNSGVISADSIVLTNGKFIDVPLTQ